MTPSRKLALWGLVGTAIGSVCAFAFIGFAAVKARAAWQADDVRWAAIWAAAAIMTLVHTIIYDALQTLKAAR